ncbi:hypothetical protein [Nocardia brasiliensis]|uniref:hypothetical protein n=1 Tax=Nocardia brasiliensis TaxID=37326 RepID=UPI00366F9C70
MSTPVERTLQAKMAAHESWARTPDRSARTANARNAMLSKFERAVDPDGLLSPEERAYRVDQAKKAHYARLALKSAQVRRRRCRNRRNQGGEL